MADSLLDFFDDWKVSDVAVWGATTTYNTTTFEYTETFASLSKTISGVKYSRSAAERYYSERFQPDVTEVLVTDYDATITTENRLVYNGTTYAIDSVVNVADQGEIMLIGLKEFT